MGVIGSMVGSQVRPRRTSTCAYGPTSGQELIRLIEDKVDIELGDVLDLPRILSVIQSHQITHIVHTAALIGELSHKNPPQSININVIGTLNILEAARFMKVQRVVYTSAKGVYGNITGEYGYPTYKPLTEDYPKNPVRIYESAKLMSEHMGQFYQRTYGLEFVALRFSQTYGPGKTVAKWGEQGDRQPDHRGGILRETGARLKREGTKRTISSTPKTRRHGIYLACTKREIHYSAYNIGTGVGVTLRDFAGEVKRLIPDADIEIGPGLNSTDGPRAAIFDISRARQDLGFSPQFPLRKGGGRLHRRSKRIWIRSRTGG